MRGSLVNVMIVCGGVVKWWGVVVFFSGKDGIRSQPPFRGVGGVFKKPEGKLLFRNIVPALC